MLENVQIKENKIRIRRRKEGKRKVKHRDTEAEYDLCLDKTRQSECVSVPLKGEREKERAVEQKRRQTGRVATLDGCANMIISLIIACLGSNMARSHHCHGLCNSGLVLRRRQRKGASEGTHEQ